MTREIKLALVLGFGLLLFSGILVSDHLAARNRGDAEDIAVEDAKNMLGDGAGDARDERLAVRTGIPAVSPVSLSDGVAGQARPSHADGSVANPMQPDLIVAIDPTVQAMHPVQPPPASERLYSVQQGETLASICRREYGSTKWLGALADYNKSTVPDPARMRVGVTIRLPEAAILTGERVASAAPAVQPSAGPAPSGALRTYTVKPGDIPGRIAQTQLGSARHVDALMEANPGVDPRRLKPGMVLNIPNIS